MSLLKSTTNSNVPASGSASEQRSLRNDNNDGDEAVVAAKSFLWQHRRSIASTGLKGSTSTSKIASLLIGDDDDDDNGNNINNDESTPRLPSHKRVQSSSLFNATTSASTAPKSSSSSGSLNAQADAQAQHAPHPPPSSSSSSSLKSDKVNEFESAFKRDHPWQGLFIDDRVDKSIEEVLVYLTFSHH